MPMVKDSLDLDILEADGQLLGAVYDGPNPGDTIIDAPGYRVGLSSFPQIAIDAYNNAYFLWSAVTPGNPSPDPYNYRHIWGRAKFHDKPAFSEMIDFNEGVLYMFTEYVYPTLAKRILNNKLELIYQSAPEPGSNIVNTAIAQHQCNIEHRQIPTSAFISSGIGKQSANQNFAGQNYPNPANGFTTINVYLAQNAQVTLSVSNIMGKEVLSMDKGAMSSGSHKITIDAGGLSSGIYFYTVAIDGESFTKKMIVE
jgi:hypothetical protein